MRIQIPVPKSTVETAPLIQRVQFFGNAITRETFRIPRGHAFLTGIQMRAGNVGSIVIPEPGSNTNWLTDDDRTIEKHVRLQFDEPSFLVEFRCYNLDDTFQHTFYIDLD